MRNRRVNISDGVNHLGTQGQAAIKCVSVIFRPMWHPCAPVADLNTMIHCIIICQNEVLHKILELFCEKSKMVDCGHF